MTATHTPEAPPAADGSPTFPAMVGIPIEDVKPGHKIYGWSRETNISMCWHLHHRALEVSPHGVAIICGKWVIDGMYFDKNPARRFLVAADCLVDD